MVTVSNLTKHFGAEGIDNISFSIEKGSVLLIIGRSGSGKTLLLKILLGLVEPDSGEAYIDRFKVSGRNRDYPQSVRKSTGVLFQNSALFDSMNVSENLRVPMQYNNEIEPENYRDISEYMLKTVKLPGILEKNIHELSGGMKRRVAIARALVNNPSIIFYDEPVTGLDPMTGKSIIDLIRELCLNRENTSVIITHDLRGFLEFADNVLLLESGERYFFGSTEEFMKSERELIVTYLKTAGYYE
ncbi:MAG: ATP-binding cassette domain-containing protein [bacterium]